MYGAKAVGTPMPNDPRITIEGLQETHLMTRRSLGQIAIVLHTDVENDGRRLQAAMAQESNPYLRTVSRSREPQTCGRHPDHT